MCNDLLSRRFRRMLLAMMQDDLSHLHWFSGEAARGHVPREICALLLREDSFTQFWRGITDGEIDFIVLFSGVASVMSDEVAALGQASGSAHWLRTAQWSLAGEVWVHARTVLGVVSSLPSCFTTSSRPMGDVIFQPGDCTIDETQLAALPVSSCGVFEVPPSMSSSEVIWVRRRRMRYLDLPFLLTEFFCRGAYAC